MALPYPGMDFVPFDVLTAEEMDMLVANIEALANGTGLGTSSVVSDNIATNAIINGYVEGLTTGQSTTSATATDCTGITITFTAPLSCTRLLLRAEAPISNTNDGAACIFAITDGSNNIQMERIYTQVGNNINQIGTITLSRRVTVTPNTSYTYKLRFRTSAGTATINQGNNAARPTVLWAQRA